MSTYTIQRGDTLSGIAKKYGTTWQDLYNANKSVIGNNPNLIYSGTVLTLPGSEQTQATQTTSTPTPTVTTTPTPTPEPVVQTTPTTPTKTTQELATEYANAQTANSANDTQALLAQYEKIAEQQKNALQQSKDLAAQQINAQREDVVNAYNDSARQAYINKMLGQKSVEQQLSQAGLNTSGLVGSAYANVENAYGNNLAALQKSRNDSINSINKQLNESNLQYAIEESKLLGDIENAKLELQKYGNELAYKKYQDALANYMNFANYDYTKAIDDRNYNYTKYIDDRNYNYTKSIDDRDFNYQKERDAVKDSQWQKEYDLSTQSLAKSSGSSRSSSRSSSGSSSKSSGSTLSLSDGNSRTTLSSAGQKIYENLGRAANLSYTKLTKDKVAETISKAYDNGAIDDTDADILFKKFGIDQ